MGLRSTALRRWLRVNAADNGDYLHLHIRERSGQRAAGLAALAGIVDAAHADQRAHCARLLAPLDPTGSPTPGERLVDLAVLATSTLQGYLGEVLAGVV